MAYFSNLTVGGRGLVVENPSNEILSPRHLEMAGLWVHCWSYPYQLNSQLLEQSIQEERILSFEECTSVISKLGLQ